MMEMGSTATTRGIRVEVRSAYIPERSNPAENRWFFTYTIRITNEGPEAARLISRHWIITDGDGGVEEVRGPGVVGEQPRLEPGQDYEYTSACPLGTNFGTMHGTYRMTTDEGREFDAEIAPFPLAEPYAIN
jgi:ApaG protein